MIRAVVAEQINLSNNTLCAGVAELADATDLKSVVLNRRVGSSPTAGTRLSRESASRRYVGMVARSWEFPPKAGPRCGGGDSPPRHHAERG